MRNHLGHTDQGRDVHLQADPDGLPRNVWHRLADYLGVVNRGDGADVRMATNAHSGCRTCGIAEIHWLIGSRVRLGVGHLCSAVALSYCSPPSDTTGTAKRGARLGNAFSPAQRLLR